MHSMPLPYTSHPLSKALLWAGVAASWLVILWILVFTTWWLDPYDAVPPQRIPQTGWDATLYHALVVSHGRQWLVGTILAVSLAWSAWLYYQVRRDPAAKVTFLRRLIMTNVGFVVIAHLGGIVVAFLPLQVVPPPGYGFAMKWLIPYGMALVGWGVLLVRLGHGRGGTAHS